MYMLTRVCVCACECVDVRVCVCVCVCVCLRACVLLYEQNLGNFWTAVISELLNNSCFNAILSGGATCLRQFNQTTSYGTICRYSFGSIVVLLSPCLLRVP